jgi:hypothetical protein
MMSTPSILPIMASANMGLLNRALAVWLVCMNRAVPCVPI